MSEVKRKHAWWHHVVVLIAILVGASLLPWWAFYYPKQIDYYMCVHHVAKKIGTDAHYDAIMQYAVDSLRPGMTQEEALQALQKLGPINAEDIHDIGKGEFGQSVIINMCFHPMNNATIFIRYSANRKLAGAVFVRNLADE